jgi:hypothetical protein
LTCVGEGLRPSPTLEFGSFEHELAPIQWRKI